ncbi:MAG: hypothetical protein Q7S55_03790 [Nanoarchaeota archaeon]|nr:hypothetical protein [Nanoarchaeota archaeon]
MKRNGSILLLIVLAVLVSSAFFLLSVFFPTIHNAIQGGATSEITTLSLTIVVAETESIVPPSGNLTPSDPTIKERVTEITDLVQGWAVNITTYGEGFPGVWSEAQPNSSQAGNNTIEYFEVDINASTAGGSYNIYFNVTQSDLAGVHPTNISLFVFNTTWQNLSTTVVNGSGDPAEFYGLTTHFSKFLIAEKPAVVVEEEEEEEESAGGSAASSGSGGGGSSSGSKKSTEETPEDNKPKEKILQPIHKPGILFDVSLVIPENYRKILPGEIILGEIKLINIKNIGLVPVQIEYLLQDVDGNILLQIYETKVIENEITYIKEIKLPTDLNPGEYMFLIKVNYGEDMALAGYPFEVIDEEEPSALAGLAAFLTNKKIFTMALPIMLGLVVLIVLILHLIRKRGRNKPKNKKSGQEGKRLQKLKSLYR